MTDTINLFSRIESAAQDGAFGQNPRPIPTDAQCNSGNYKVGRVKAFGLKLAIEQPRNSYRTGIDKKTDGRWTTRLAAHYGYISGTKGADGDPVDVFIGFYPQSEYAWVINQYVNGQWDEHKIMLAFPDEASARQAYLDSYEKGWNGLHSIVKASITQLQWWLKNGNLTKPLAPEHLPYDGLETMTQRVTWDSAGRPINMTLDKVIYEIRRADGDNTLLLDSVSMADILEEADEILVFDALVSTQAKLEGKMNALMAVMTRAGGDIKPVAMQISDPFKQNGVAQVAAVLELSDGQTVSIFFHNPDVSPAKIGPTDEMISWKWLLNKKDITIVVAPERGKDLNVREVATRLMKLAVKNSQAFQRVNTKRAENMAAIKAIKGEIVVLEKELADAQHELEVARVEAEDRAARAGNADMQTMIDEAAKWKGATMQVAAMLEGNKKDSLALSRMTTKGDLDAYLMRKFGVDETTARDVSNALTSQDIQADMTANLEDYKDEPWYSLISQVGTGEVNQGSAGEESPETATEAMSDYQLIDSIVDSKKFHDEGIGSRHAVVIKNTFKALRSNNEFLLVAKNKNTDEAQSIFNDALAKAIQDANLMMGKEFFDKRHNQSQLLKRLVSELPKGKLGKKGAKDPAVNPNQPHIDTLQAIVDGQYDADDLTELLDKIDKAAQALIDAGMGEQFDELIGKTAEHWAALDQKANG
jgi:hypothetical protein